MALCIVHLAVQQRGHLLAEVLDDGIGTALDLQALGDGVQLDTGIDGPGNVVNLLGLLVGPHGGAELYGC